MLNTSEILFSGSFHSQPPSAGASPVIKDDIRQREQLPNYPLLEGTSQAAGIFSLEHTEEQKQMSQTQVVWACHSSARNTEARDLSDSFIVGAAANLSCTQQ